MTNPRQPDPNLPSALSGTVPRRLSYAAVTSTTVPAPNFMNHPARTSVISQLLNRNADMTSDSSTNHYSSTRSPDGDHERYGSRSNTASIRQGDGNMEQQSQFGSLSRAFEILANGAHDDGSTAGHDGFFIPSYLRDTTYARKLRDCTRRKVLASQHAKAAQVTARTSGAASTAVRATNGSSLGTKTVQPTRPVLDRRSHSSLAEYKDETPPIPAKWNKDDKHAHGIDVLGERQLEVRYTTQGKGQLEYETASIRADYPVPPECGLYYFEVTILAGKSQETTIGVGLSAKSVHLHRPPGWEPDSYGYHGDDGHCFTSNSTGRMYGPKFTSGDVIGCGINFNTGSIFFTKNGQPLGSAFTNVNKEGKAVALYPSVGLKKHGEHIRVNFGQTPFVFDIDGMMKREKNKIRDQLSNINTTHLVPKLSEKDLIQTLVLQFLQHDGYIDTARTFADEIQTERRALAVGNRTVNDIHVKDDQHATNRQCIRKAILDGDIKGAVKYIESYYPNLLPDNDDVFFELKCRRFIEMVRKAAEARLGSEGPKTNGHDSSQAMELDSNGLDPHPWEDTDMEDGIDHAGQLEQDMLSYGRELETDYRDHPNKNIRDTLETIFSLMAYANPLKEARVSYLLDRKGRIAVAETVNSRILEWLKKSVASDLEKFYRSTDALVEQLREGGGPGAFVSVQDIIDEIPKTQQN